MLVFKDEKKQLENQKHRPKKKQLENQKQATLVARIKKKNNNKKKGKETYWVSE